MEYVERVEGRGKPLAKEPRLPGSTPVQARPDPNRHKKKRAASELGEMLLSFAGKAKGLPGDMAENHDHYLYGTPKK